MTISIRKLLNEWSCDPFENIVWGIPRPVTREEVAQAIADNDLEATPFDLTENPSRFWHIRRIAYFVVNGWNNPIDLDLGVPSLGCHVAWPIQDGNHRFAAAVYLGHKSIEAEVSGETKWIKRFAPRGSKPLTPA